MSMEAHGNLDKRPTRKHIAERQRRARINHLLEQLESLISSADNETHPVKLEKAEVLERTVEYIKRMKETDNTSTYVYGYMSCVRGVGKYLNDAQIPPSMLHNIQSYLLSNISRRDQTVTELSETNNNDPAFGCKKDIVKHENEQSVSVSHNIECDVEIVDMSTRKTVNYTNQNNFDIHVWRPW